MPRPDAPVSRTHVAALDGVRGLAILLVLVFHFASWASDSVSFPALFQWTALGRVGVDLFFVLSGYLITGILWDSRGSEAYFKNFYVRRALRIFPLYYLVVFGVAVAAPLVAPDSEKIRALTAQQGWLWSYTVNIAVAVKNRWTFYGMNHLWSLSVEEQFYLVWPFVVWRLGRVPLLRLCGVLIVASVLARAALLYGLPAYGLGAYTLTFCRMDTLLLGGALALEARAPAGEGARGGWARGSRRAAVPVLLGLLAIQAVPAWRAGQADTLGWVLLPTLWAIVFGGLIAESVLDGPLKRAFERPGLRFLGRYSYGIYVFHHPMRQLFEKLAPPAKLAATLHSALAATLVFTLVGIAVTTGVAWTSYHVFEARFLALKSRFEPRPAVDVFPARDPARVPLT